MGIQKNNSNVTVNTLSGAIDMTKKFSLQLASLYDYDDKYFSSDITLEKNMVMELTNGKRGGANRLRVYLNKRNGLYAVSIRYGINITGWTEVIDACKGYSLSYGDKDYTVDFSGHLDAVARDGKTESRIQFMVSRCGEFLRLVEAVKQDDIDAWTSDTTTPPTLDKTYPITVDESVTA